MNTDAAILPFNRNPNCPGRRQGFALLQTFLLIVILVAVTVELTTVVATESALAIMHGNDLSHSLAVDSALLLVADKLQSGDDGAPEIVAQLDKTGRADLQFAIGSAAVSLVIRDDASKFNPNVLARDDQTSVLRRAIQTLGARSRLPLSRTALRPVLQDEDDATSNPYRWFDQLFDQPAPGTFFDWGVGEFVWSDVLTFWGDGRVDVRRADSIVIDALLDDLRPGLGRRLLSKRNADRAIDFLPAALASVDSEVRHRVTERLAFDVQRYAIEIKTAIKADGRRWYVVALILDGHVDVLHRSEVTW